ncbi:MAG: hypothetical protein U5K79_02025 [Cyclobacteriaceae bacterium]|nr:hypothetical protein [Cyclobacteriaceae bacterium]
MSIFNKISLEGSMILVFKSSQIHPIHFQQASSPRMSGIAEVFDIEALCTVHKNVEKLSVFDREGQAQFRNKDLLSLSRFREPTEFLLRIG